MLTVSTIREGVHSYDSQRQNVRVLLHGRTLIIKPWQRRSKRQQENEAADMWAIKTATRFLVPARNIVEKCSQTV